MLPVRYNTPATHTHTHTALQTCVSAFVIVCLGPDIFNKRDLAFKVGSHGNSLGRHEGSLSFCFCLCAFIPASDLDRQPKTNDLTSSICIFFYLFFIFFLVLVGDFK